MSDDFGTVSVRRGEREREVEVLRQRYRQHREALMRLVGDAPSEHLAIEYQRLVRDVDAALAKIDEIEGRNAAGTASSPRLGAAVPPAAPSRGTNPIAQAQGDPLRSATEPGTRPLIPAPGMAEEPDRGSGTRRTNNQSRVVLIAFVAIVVLGIIGWLIWRASSDRKATIQEATTAPVAATETAPVTTAPVTPAAPPAALTIAPEVVDFGSVTKGTRAARQLEITNNGTGPVAIQLSRSKCRCLFYEYATQLVPNKKETITVTVDGARAKAGVLDETITISGKKDPSLTGSFQVTGTVK